METKLALDTLGPIAAVTPSPAPPAPTSDAAMMQDDVADLRLVIEKDQASGIFIYKTIDRRTGDVVLQLPREEVVRMYAAADYAAGAIVKTKA
ncbi:flagellar protein FlaG [Phenylobacterium sp.]|uniref:flagellar protein FlaG n=1 Tax=Phenylobacterium sp. TaxID=1871053 RepID=UPI002DE754AB|nr:flagellar protein FlaG [Phenylobacterium sp.]